MNILITGANGFAGRHLVAHLTHNPTYRLYGTCYTNPAALDEAFTSQLVRIQQLDVRDYDAVVGVIRTVRPTWIFHLAAQSFVPASFKDPWGTFETNVRGTLNLFDALRHLNMTDVRVVNVSSSEVYGMVRAEDIPLRETQLPNPANPYAVSKLSQDALGKQYHMAHKLNIITARPFSHTGTGQETRFVFPDFASQIAKIEAGQAEPILTVGNLSAERDYSDVRDVVRAYELLAAKGTAGDVYHVCSGQGYVLQNLVEQLLSMAKVDIQIKVDQARFRPVELPRLVGDNSKIKQAVGWQPAYTITQTLQAVLDDCRHRVQNTLP